MSNLKITTTDKIIIATEKAISKKLDEAYGDTKFSIVEFNIVRDYSITIASEALLSSALYGDIFSHRVATAITYAIYYLVGKFAGKGKKSSI